MSALTFAENIRLVVWDLDETYWNGTLEEGAVTISSENRSIPKILAKRGIISSICSKNSFEPVRVRLEQEDLWKWFVFPMVDYEFKSVMVQQIIEQMGLRPETILFIDDNPFNRGEVAERLPGINVAAETIIPELLEHPQLQGKPDLEMTRLERYKILQMKQQNIAKAEKPSDFLRECKIRVSIHYDALEQFDRIHDMVNRTNQLNFTKKRWNEDMNIARREYEENTKKTYNMHVGYVKVRDKFGYYGICGYFELQVAPTVAGQFLFSCRVLNMGVEQFVYQLLKFPGIKVTEPVVAKLVRRPVVDWIRVVPDAEEADGTPGIVADNAPRLCLHGPCELVQSAHYLRPYFNITEEFQYPRAGWAVQRPLVRYLALSEELAARGLTVLTQLGLPEDFPGIDLATLSSAIMSPDVTASVFSFTLESEISIYRHKPTGLLIPLSIGRFDREDLTSLDSATLQTVNPQIKEEDVAAMRSVFEFHSRFDHDLLAADLSQMAVRLRSSGKRVIVVEGFDKPERIDRPKYHHNRTTNQLVRQAFAGLPHVCYISVADYVTSLDQQVEINHFVRPVYAAIAQRIREESSVQLPEPI